MSLRKQTESKEIVLSKFHNYLDVFLE